MSRRLTQTTDEFDIYVGAKQLARTVTNRDEAIRISSQLSLVHGYVRVEQNGKTVRVLKRTVGEK